VILAGDIGGTKTHLALYPRGGDARSPVFERRHQSRDAPSLAALVESFIAAAPGRPCRAVLGIAGPVVENRSDTTNLPWDVDAVALGEHLGGLSVTIVNDLVATAHGLRTLSDGDIETLAEGRMVEGNRALIAAGTGLGEALLAWNGSDWHPMASEGGHADFAPRGPLEDELMLWLRAKYGHVSCERILSGPGLADLYRFMRDSGRGAEPAACAERFDQATDPAAAVTELALEGACERATLAIGLFVDVYGAEAGNLALKALAVGGVYVGGGIAPRLRAFLGGERFVAAFRDKGRLRPLMESIPVRLVLEPRTALWGAAEVALAASNREDG
jgi:glucokinase